MRPMFVTLLLVGAACDGDKQPATDDTGPPADDSGGADSGGGDDTAVTTCGGDASRTAAMGALVTATEAFLASLDATQRDTVSFAMDDSERMEWDNRPVPSYARVGLPFGDLSAEQLALAYAMLEAALSVEGYERATNTILVDQIAADGGDPQMGEKYYYLGIFDTPSLEGAWGLQLDGHHLATNWTMAGCEIVMTPAFYGIRPTEVPTGEHAGLRVLGDFTDLAMALMASLSEAQLDAVIVSEVAASDLEVGPHADGEFPTAPLGLAVSELDAEQQVLFLDLVAAWVGGLPAPYGETKLAEVGAMLSDTHFAWMGPVDENQLHYYRIHGPSLWIEYDVIGSIDHIHAIWRDPLDDYGADLLAEHYAAFVHARPLPPRRVRPIWDLPGMDALLARPLSETR